MTLDRARRSVLATATLALLAGPLAAQSAEDPRLAFSTFGGYIGGGNVWQLSRQLAAVVSGELDTLTLARAFKPGLALGLGISLFRSPHLGWSLELAFFGTSTESRCRPVGGYAYDSQQINQQACEDAQGKVIRTNAVAIQPGLTWRLTNRGPVQTYVRASAGAAFLGGSFVDTRGMVALQGGSDSLGSPIRARVFLTERDRNEVTWIASAAAGATLEMAPGYQLRFELRDLIFNVPVVTGPADYHAIDAYPEVGRKTFHLPTLTVGLDIVLERQRRRRY